MKCEWKKFDSSIYVFRILRYNIDGLSVENFHVAVRDNRIYIYIYQNNINRSSCLFSKKKKNDKWNNHRFAKYHTREHIPAHTYEYTVIRIEHGIAQHERHFNCPRNTIILINKRKIIIFHINQNDRSFRRWRWQEHDFHFIHSLEVTIIYMFVYIHCYLCVPCVCSSIYICVCMRRAQGQIVIRAFQHERDQRMTTVSHFWVYVITKNENQIYNNITRIKCVLLHCNIIIIRSYINSIHIQNTYIM